MSEAPEQRPIKFRAYDLEHHHMYANAYPFEHLVYVEMDPNDPEVKPFESKMHKVNGKWFYFIVAKDIALMEYTGLQDTNGRNICEGDIVQWYAIDGIHRQAVTYLTDRAMFLPNDMQGEVVVIGNIHEHPEILDGKPK